MRHLAPHIRQGMTLLEIMAVMAILALVMAIAIPAVNGVLQLEQAGAAKELALTYKYLRDEAALRNVSFRVVYNLDLRTYKVEVGDPDTLIFSDPEERARFEEDFREQMSRFTERELEEGAGADLEATAGRFEGLSDPALESEVELPNGSFFAWVYTPQYEDPVEPNDPPAEDPEEQAIAYSYIFPNGFIEHTVVRIADIDEPEQGFTLEIEPVSGRVVIHDEDFTAEDSLSWVPEEAPELDL